jgi:hypothetical protein
VASLSNSSSYKKTVFLKPRSPSTIINKGYDQVAHNSLIREYQIPSPDNGCALNDHNTSNAENSDIINTIVSLIKTLLSQYKNTLQPSNVAVLFDLISTLISNNGSKNHTVELQERDI